MVKENVTKERAIIELNLEKQSIILKEIVTDKPGVDRVTVFKPMETPWQPKIDEDDAKALFDSWK